MTDVFSREKRSEIMSKIRSKNTSIERRFMEKHPNAVPHPDWLPYHPDFLFDGKVIYLDSRFWHGYVGKDRYDRLPPYWREKLFRNIVRDCVRDAFWEAVGRLIVVLE